MPTNSTQLLDLRDIHTPAVVSWWPLSALTWLLIVIILLTAALLVWRWLRRRANKQFDIDALQTLVKLERGYVEHGDLQRFLYDLSVYLRRLMLNRCPSKEFSRLRREHWCDYLNAIIHRSGTRNPIYFTHDDFRLMDRAIYRKTIEHPQFDVIRFRQSALQLITALSTQAPVKESTGVRQ